MRFLVVSFALRFDTLSNVLFKTDWLFLLKMCCSSHNPDGRKTENVTGYEYTHVEGETERNRGRRKGDNETEALSVRALTCHYLYKLTIFRQGYNVLSVI